MFRYTKIRHTNGIRFIAIVSALSSLSLSSISTGQTPLHNHAIVEWSAALTGAKDTSSPQIEAVQTHATGKATASFDFDHQSVTFNVEAKDVTGIQKIELRTARSHGDLSGPAILTIYDSHDGPFPGTVTKTITGQSFKQVANPVLNGHGVVVVNTVAHPDGEIAGFIVMRKRYQ